MALQKILALGHSHLGALSSAYENRDANFKLGYEATFYQFLRSDRPHIVHRDEEGWRYNPEIEREIFELIENIKPAAVVIMLQGEQTILSGLIEPVRPYEFFFPQEIGYAPDPSVEIVPFDILFAEGVNKFRLAADFLDRLVSRLPPVAFAICPPPIVGDAQFVKDGLGQHAEILGQIEKTGLPSTAWRRRIWKLHAMALRSIYSARKIAFLDPPAGSYGDDGCLRVDFRSDVFHANAAYGQLLLKQIDELLKQSIL